MILADRFVLTAMAAKESVCVSPMEKRVSAHVSDVGREAIRNVMPNESRIASSRIADNSRPDALMTGVCRCRQKMAPTPKVTAIPETTTKISFGHILKA